jgi:sugar-specific transcriptional regulator TrmB/DNA-binding CsgD family transcriptional regulator
MAPKPTHQGSVVTLQPIHLEALQMLGLNEVSIKAYQLMLVSDSWSLEELPGALNVSPQELRPALDSLIGNSLIVPSQECSDRLHPVSPRVGLSRLLDQRDSEIRRTQNELAQARHAADQLIEVVDDLDKHRRASLEQIHGRDQVGDRIAELLRGANREVLTMLTRLPTPETLDHARQGDEALLERGVQTRLIVLAGHIRRSRPYVEHLEHLITHGARVRVATTLPSRVIVVDREVAVVPSDPSDTGAGATVVHQRALVQLTLDAFESAWAQGNALNTATKRPEVWQPSELEREVIRLLGEGNKDEAIARRVGMSLRSVRRIVAQISMQLGVESRFALGVACSAQGWVSPR